MDFRVVCLLASLVVCDGATFPSGCTYQEYTKPIGVYTCDFTNASFPVALSSFSSPNPQRLKITFFNGNLVSSSVFSGFNAYDVSTFDTNYRASLEISCATSGTLGLSTTSFTDMTYIQELRITGCNLDSGIPANVFSGMQLDYLEIDKGIIASTDSASLTGLTIAKISTIPNPIGGFTIRNAQLTAGELAANFFSPLTSAVSITVDNANLINLTSGMFSSNTALQTINLSRNKFTKVSYNLFSGLKSLTSINMSYIDWDCTCTDLGFQHSLSSNYINLHGNIQCMTPTSYQYMKWTQFYFNECENKDYCFGVPGSVSGVFCYQWHQILFYFLLMIAFVASAISVFIVINVRRKMMQIIREIEAKKRKAFMKVKEALVRGRDGQHAPAATAMMGMKERKWIETTVP